jgi:hydrogenase maturation protein HypF
MIGKTIRICGTVQGVGFRPTVWRLANEFDLVGAVWNDAEGVGISVWGAETALDEFIRQLSLQAPPAAKITGIVCTSLLTRPDSNEFSILPSANGLSQTAICADIATCSACIAEVVDAGNRRYRYPFTNCTNCGPRLSIIKAIPYDRINTTMSAFKLCADCQTEYLNASDRRFHAQPNACPTCGPKISLVNRKAEAVLTNHSDSIKATAELIQLGEIVAIKGIGGFHLACDAGNQAAVAELRVRKNRYEKPFAIMVRDVEMLGRYTKFDALEKQLLEHAAAPIVLLDQNGGSLADAVAPDQNSLGCMLPYTPLHHLLMQELEHPIVLTSGNLNHEPQCLNNDQAMEELQGIADFWLLNDREIVCRLDDSVVKVMDTQARILRRARGYAPEPIDLPPGFKNSKLVLATGGELKNTFCLLKNHQAIISQHIGDLENPATQTDYRNMLELYQDLFDFQPEMIAVDLHQGYFSTQFGQQFAEQLQLPLQYIQHHHAHIAACMAEYGLPIDSKPVLGVAMDGLGMGPDKQLWGAEFLKADYRHYHRLACFQAMPLLGGNQAMRQPWRNCYVNLKTYFDWPAISSQYADLDIIRFLTQQPLDLFDTMIAKNLNSPLSSSCGRWFDGFAAALGIYPETISYEGQAAIRLETLATSGFDQQRDYAYPYQTIYRDGLQILSWKPFWQGVLDDLKLGLSVEIIAARIHHGLAKAITETAIIQADSFHCDTVILSGGVFQNRLLLEEVSRLLRANHKTVLSPSKLPCNDGGIAFGQAVVAAACVSV